LRKRFERPAVDGLDLRVRAGEFYMLLGPNGAGKTTTLRMVSGLLQPDEGAISVFGDRCAGRSRRRETDHRLALRRADDLRQAHADRISRIRRGTVERRADACENRARELLAWLGLEKHAHERCEQFSRGMRQKVALAGALVHDPKLIILDEPLTGLDAGSARLVKNVLTERVRAGNTVIMTTHILEIAERMADRIGVISSGKLIAEGTLARAARPRRPGRCHAGGNVPLHRRAGSGGRHEHARLACSGSRATKCASPGATPFR
jgi:ABC-2 type transport system ATP-binding protein